jgi:multicomponent Na+:H+ antiporter subunit E
VTHVWPGAASGNSSLVAGYLRRLLALAAWGLIVWVIETWTLTVEQLVIGVMVALAAAAALAPLGDIAPPWRLLDPRIFWRLVVLLVDASRRVVLANLRLARRIWLPSRPLRPGMVIVPTEMRTEGGLTAVGIVTSVIVDNQLVDIDRSRHELQYHAVAVTTEEPEQNSQQMNAPVERWLKGVVRRR